MKNKNIYINFSFFYKFQRLRLLRRSKNLTNANLQLYIVINPTIEELELPFIEIGQ